MITTRQIMFLLCVCALLAASMAQPDSAGSIPTPAPGLSYGGIPYGSMSGNVAEFFRQQAPSVARRVNYAALAVHAEPNFAPIEQWL